MRQLKAVINRGKALNRREFEYSELEESFSTFALSIMRRCVLESTAPIAKYLS